MNYKLTPLFILIFICLSPVQAKMYKWVDDEGVVHFGDMVPTEQLNKERRELNSQGVTVKAIPPAETEEQRKERFRLERIEREEKKKVEELRKQDKVLMDTYTTESDLDAALKARLDAVESQLQLSKSIIESAKKKQEKTEKAITRIKASGKEVPKNLLDKMENESKQLKTYQKLAIGHETRKQEITEQFGAYIKRFRELKANQNRIKEKREARRREALGL